MPSNRQRHRHDLQAIAHRAMLERGLLPDFAPEVTAEADRAPESAPARGDGVQDLTGLAWISIDNDDSRDLDQLSVAERGSGAVTRILVAIADVDALVPNGSAVDGHARTNTTSVYTAAEIFPMLPTRLSTDLTSLGEDDERLAIVIEMSVRDDGEIDASSIYRARVKNRAKLAYDSVSAWLEGEAPPPGRVASVRGIDEQVRLQDRVAQCLRAVRQREGALTLESIEPKAVFDGNDLSDLKLEEKNRAKELIEDLMVAANGVTARFLEGKRIPSLRRVLRSPERWGRIVDLAATFGESLPSDPDAPALEGFLTRRRKADPLRFPDLSLSVVKLMGRGEYAVDQPGRSSLGHFGLAVHDYTHSTAPNRRYPDLVTQRLIKAALDRRAPMYAEDELQALALHCSAQENNANKVERQVRKSAAAMLLESRVGERFDGIVTGASDKGTWVRVLHPPVEGRVVRGAEGMDVGERVRVELLDTDVERGYIDFGRARS